MKTLVCAIATMIVISLALVSDQRSNAAFPARNCNLRQDPSPTPTPKSNRDLCIEGEPGACINYNKEIKKECGKAPVKSAQPTQQEFENNSNWLVCMRRAQCWEDRAVSLRAVEDLCRAGEDKPECVEARYRNSKVDPKACDKPPKPNTF